MSDFHDPVRQATSLSEVFAQDKRPLGLFLTAGCPFSIKRAEPPHKPLIPDIAGLTAIVAAKLPADIRAKFDLASKSLEEDGRAHPNIEDILTYVRSLRQIVGTGSVREFNVAELDALNGAISEQIVKIVNVELPEDPNSFDQVARWIGSTQRSFPVELFTTNYDLLLEKALERNRIPFFDGFSGVQNAFLDQQSLEDDRLPARWARVWKLHGSINWKLDELGNAIRSNVSDTAACPLIHPSHLKYSESRRMPYLAMIDRMRAFLKQPSALLAVCGYSFGDDHLNEVLLQGAQANPTAAIFALQYGLLEGHKEAIKLGEACANINVLAADAALIGRNRAQWLAKQSTGLSANESSTFWKSDGEAVGDLVGGHFLLGDFVQFGKFLSRVVQGSR